MAKDDQSSYYDAGGIDMQDVIKAKLTHEQYIGFLLGNSLKYQLRFNFKHAGTGRIRDAQKSANYLQWLRDELERQEASQVAVESDPDEEPAKEAWKEQFSWP